MIIILRKERNQVVKKKEFYEMSDSDMENDELYSIAYPNGPEEYDIMMEISLDASSFLEEYDEKAGEENKLKMIDEILGSSGVKEFKEHFKEVLGKLDQKDIEKAYQDIVKKGK